MNAQISYNTFLSTQLKRVNLSKDKHHPNYHFEGAPHSYCPLCDVSQESPRQLYNRMYPNATSQGKVLKLEILENNVEESLPEVKNEQEELKKEGILDKTVSIFRESAFWERAVEKRKSDFESKFKQIEAANSLNPSSLNGKQILVLPNVGYLRSFTIIECLKEIENKLNKKLIDKYDAIAASGNSALIACLISLGIDISDIKEFWLNEWRSAHRPNAMQRTARWAFNMNPFAKNRFGYSTKYAVNILKKVFRQGDNETMQLKFEDLKTEVYLPITYLAKKETYDYDKVNSSELPIVDCLSSIVFDPFHFDVKEEIKGKGIAYPVQDIELNVLQNNKDALVTKVEVYSPHNDFGPLNNATDVDLARPVKEVSDFLRKIDLEAHVKNFKPKRVKLETKRIPNHFDKNSTDMIAINQAINAGKGATVISF